MKRKIKLSESKLNRIITESIKQVLINESSPEIDNLKKQSRTYGSHASDPNIMTKTFNRGMGKLDFIQMIPEENVLLVNKMLARPKDMERIKECFPEWTIEYVSLGYPDWYFNSLKTMRGK